MRGIHVGDQLYVTQRDDTAKTDMGLSRQTKFIERHGDTPPMTPFGVQSAASDEALGCWKQPDGPDLLCEKLLN